VIKVRAVSSTPGTVTFRLNGTIGVGADGGLFLTSDATGTPAGQRTVSAASDGSEYSAAVFYRVPDDFANSGSTFPDARSERPLTFSAHLAGIGGAVGDTDLELHLRHAPVLFVHGIWSDSSAWDDFSVSRELVERGEALAPGWDGVSSIQSGAQQILPYLNSALQHMRVRGIAASRVDIVAHSMGGLLAKKIVADGSQLVHKLITIDTPHFGSALADFLIANRNDPIIAGWFVPAGHAIGRAIDDLRVSAGAAVQARTLHTGALPVHSIVGIASDDEPCQSWDRNQLPQLVSAFCLNPLFAVSHGFFTNASCKTGLLTQLLGGKVNDEVVDTESQRGGLSATTSFGSGTLRGQHVCMAAHTVVTFNGEISTAVRNLLNTSVRSSSFAEYSVVGASTDIVNRPIPGSDLLKSEATQTAIQLVSPLPGQLVLPGSAFDVTLITTDVVNDLTVVTPDEIIIATGLPPHARVDIPAVRIGDYAILALGTMASGAAAASEVITVKVTPTATIGSLALSPLDLFLRIGEAEQISVRGVFGDGVPRQMTGSSNVTYSSSDVSVAVVQPDGRVHAVGAGHAVIKVSAGDGTGEVAVSVESAPRTRAVAH